MNLDETAFDIHTICVAKGFYAGELTTDKAIAKLALIHSEVTETLEAIRKEKGERVVVEEMADIIIRVLDLWAALWGIGINTSLEEILLAKIEKNRHRPALHGHKWG